MRGQIVEITQPGYALNKSRGFLEVRHERESIGQVSLDDIAAVIVSVPGCLISTVLIDHLCQQNIPLVICGKNYMPSSITLPVQGYGRQFQTMHAQVKLSEPRRKRAWQRIVKAKINNQAEVLARAGENSRQLIRLAEKTRSGDMDNHEAQAARIYWPRLFGKDFRRNPDSPGLNAALNYIYAIVRACVARGISSAGLHPSFSLHHKNSQNPLNLVDDLMEPLRPVADYMLWHTGTEQYDELSPKTKKQLAAITTLVIPLGDETSPLSLATSKMGRSFAVYCLGEADTFLCPELPFPIDLPVL